ncbi:MAG: BNR-4 repeat-containing protein [Pseudomonadota bacterium]
MVSLSDPHLRIYLDFVSQQYHLWDGSNLNSHSLSVFPGFSVARATEATAWTVGPTLTSFAAQAARVGAIDPASGQPLGAHIEPASTRKSRYFATPYADWETDGAAGIQPDTNTYLGQFANGAVISSNGAVGDSLKPKEGIILVGGSSYGYQFYYIAGSSPTVGFLIRKDAGGIPASLIGRPGDLKIENELSGSITNLTQDFIVDSGTTKVHRVRFTFTPNSPGSHAHRPYVGPYSTGVSDSMIFLGGGVESNPFPTTPVLHQPDQLEVTRGADLLEIGSLGSIFPASVAITAVVDSNLQRSQLGAGQIISLSNGTASERHRLLTDASSILAGATTSNSATAGEITGPVFGGRNKICYRANSAGFSLHRTGSKLGDGPSGNLPTQSLTKLEIGHNAGSDVLDGSIRTIEIYAGPKDDLWGTENSRVPGMGTAVAGHQDFIPYKLDMYELPDLNNGSPAFDSLNNAYLRYDGKFVAITSEGTVVQEFEERAAPAIDALIPGTDKWDRGWDKTFSVDNKIYIDDSDRLYTLIIPRNSNMSNPALLWSDDQGANWSAVYLSRSNSTMEQRDWNNDLTNVPTILSYDSYSSLNPGLWLENLSLNNGNVVVNSPTLIANNSILIANHSGGANSTFTTSDKIFVVYPTNEDHESGTQAMVAEVTRSTGSLVGAANIELGWSTTSNTLLPDVHNIPAITGDSKGHLHVVLGAHQARFKYTKSSVANDAHSGWSPAIEIGEEVFEDDFGLHTYLSILMMPDDTMVIVCRTEGDGYRFRLSQITLDPSSPTPDVEVKWGPDERKHRQILGAYRAFYGAYRHRLTRDRLGNLYLHARWWPNELTNDEAKQIGLDPTVGDPRQRTDGRLWYYHAPYFGIATLVSPDNGQTWQSLNPKI